MRSKIIKINIWQDGLTLIEVIVGVAVLSLVLGLVMNALYMSARSWNLLEGYTDTADSRRLGLRFMQKQISQTTPLMWKDESGERLIFHGSRKSLDFVSRVPSHFGENGMKLVSFFLTEGNREKKLIFGYRSIYPGTYPLNTSREYEGDIVTIIDGIYGLDIDYFGRMNGESRPRWHPNWFEEEQLPMLIKLSLKFEPSGQWQEHVFAVFSQINDTFPQLTITKPGIEPPVRKDADSDLELYF